MERSETWRRSILIENGDQSVGSTCKRRWAPIFDCYLGLSTVWDETLYSWVTHIWKTLIFCPVESSSDSVLGVYGKTLKFETVDRPDAKSHEEMDFFKFVEREEHRNNLVSRGVNLMNGESKPLVVFMTQIRSKETTTSALSIAPWTLATTKFT